MDVVESMENEDRERESMDEDFRGFTGFEQETIVINPEEPSKFEHNLNETQDETDSDSGNLIIAEPQKKQEVKSSEKSPRKRKPKVEDITPTRARSSRVKGQGLAFLIAMEKGGSKKQMAKAQAQVDALDASIAAAVSSTEVWPQFSHQQFAESPIESFPENKKAALKDLKDSTKVAKEKESLKSTKDPVKQLKEKDAGKERETAKSPLPAIARVPSPSVSIKSGKSSASRKSFAAVNISSPLLKEPFKEGKLFFFLYFLCVNCQVFT